jgi:branched-chain amino acid transport system substrate-binding protein
VRQGIEIAIDELKSAGIATPKLFFEDDKCLAKEAVTAFKRLSDDRKVSLVVGPACSTSIKSVAPLVSKGSIPVIFLLDTGESVASLADPIYSFGFDPKKLAGMLAEDLYGRSLRNVGMITEDEEYSVLISESFKERWKSLGGNISGVESLPINSPDSRSSIARVLSKKPEAILFSSAYSAGIFLSQLRSLAPTIPVYGNDTMCAANTINSAGTSAEGARCGNVILNESVSEVKAFRRAMERKFGKAPSSLFYPALGYDSVRLIFKELNLSGISGKPLLGVEARSASGIYDIMPSILEIRKGKLELISSHL